MFYTAEIATVNGLDILTYSLPENEGFLYATIAIDNGYLLEYSFGPFDTSDEKTGAYFAVIAASIQPYTDEELK